MAVFFFRFLTMMQLYIEVKAEFQILCRYSFLHAYKDLQNDETCVCRHDIMLKVTQG